VPSNTQKGKRILVCGAICGAPTVTATALKFYVAWNQFSAGYHAYNQGRGPGADRIRAAGWLQAARELRQHVEERQEERRCYNDSI
jgi:hypothetical protein